MKNFVTRRVDKTHQTMKSPGQQLSTGDVILTFVEGGGDPAASHRVGARR